MRRAENRTLPAVLVHGLIGTLDDQDLVRHFWPRPILAPDLLGYGTYVRTPLTGIGLGAQVDHLQRQLDDAGLERVHLVGHSVGGAVAALFADQYPGRAASLVSVEGNFSLADAFWSSSVAAMTVGKVEEMLSGQRADPAGWLRDAGVVPEDGRLALARRWLDQQPASTVHAMARAVVETTGQPAYERMLRRVFDRTPVYLVSGERSRDAWHVPTWALTKARSLTVIADAGHLVMIEAPQRFGETISLLLADAESRLAT